METGTVLACKRILPAASSNSSVGFRTDPCLIISIRVSCPSNYLFVFLLGIKKLAYLAILARLFRLYD